MSLRKGMDRQLPYGISNYRCVDYTFVMFQSRDHVREFADYINNKHVNISFQFTEKSAYFFFFR